MLQRRGRMDDSLTRHTMLLAIDFKKIVPKFKTTQKEGAHAGGRTPVFQKWKKRKRVGLHREL